MRPRRNLIIFGVLAATSLAAPIPLPATETGQLVGSLIDNQNQYINVGHAVVFLCDAATGAPIVASTKKPFDTSLLFKARDKEVEHDFHNPWYAVTMGRGDFQFADVPAGKYRLIAQAWAGAAGLPPMRNTSDTIILHGVAEDVVVRTGETTRAFLAPLGSGKLTFENDPPGGGAFLVLSTAPRHGDAILGPPAWGTNFIRHVIGVQHMAGRRTTVYGLPEGKEIHVGLFAYDNSPGTGGGTYVVGAATEVKIPIWANWSNGKRDPPPNLAKLVAYLEEHDPSLPELMQLGAEEDFKNERGRRDDHKIFAAVLDAGDKSVVIKGLGEVRVIDIQAAEGYRRLREYHRDRDRQREQAIPKSE